MAVLLGCSSGVGLERIDAVTCGPASVPATTVLFNDLPVAALVHRISGLVVEYIVAIDVTRVRFPADAYWCGL